MGPIPISDDKICILVMGDFLGTGSAPGGQDEVTWNPVKATPDSMVRLAGLRPRIPMGPGPEGPVAEMAFDSMESMDPGEIFRRSDLFSPLREAREAAGNAPSPPDQPEEAPAGGTTLEPEGGADLLDAILDVSQQQDPGPEPGSPEEIEAFVREVVRPHLVRDDSDQKGRIAAVDEAISRQMSALIHSPPFQRLEAIWRSVVFLLSRIDATGKARVHLLHLPKGGLERELAEDPDLRGSRLQDLLVSPELGVPGRRWALVVGAYDFAFTSGDLELLGRIAGVAREADVPFVAGMRAPGEDPEEVGRLDEDPSSAWQALRESPGAGWLGLTYPRFLLREPYGVEGRRVRSFDFQEEIPSREALLWGSGAFLSAALIAQELMTRDGAAGAAPHLELLGVPLAGAGPEKGGPATSLETRLTPGDVGAFLEMGLMPLFGHPDRASVRLATIQSVRDPQAPLSAWWKR